MGKNAKVPPASSGRILACSIAALLLANAPMVLSQESTWIGTESSNWSVPANWQGGAVPVGGPDSALRFTARGTAPITSTHDLAAPFSVGDLRFENLGIGLFTVSGSALQLTGASSEIIQAGRGHVTLSTPLILNAAGGGAVRIAGNGLGNLTIAGPIAETGGSASLLIAGQPLTAETQVITLSGANSSTGGITLESGNLALGTDAIGANNAPLIVKGGSLRFGQGASFTNPVSLHSDLVLRGDISGQLGPISSAVAGTGLTMRTTGTIVGYTGVPRLTIAEPSGYTGATWIDSGTPTFIRVGIGYASLAPGDLALSGGGSILNTSRVDVRSGGGIMIDGTAGGILDRINDAAPLELHGGRLTLRAVAGSAAPQAETIGDIKVGGLSTITIDVSADPTIEGRILASSLERTGKGTLFLRGIPAGENPTAASSRGRVLLASPPIDMAGSGTGVKMPIVPYVIGQATSNNTLVDIGLVTYTDGLGLRLLAQTEYATQFGVEGSNVRLTKSPATDHGSQTINSLVLSGNFSLWGTGELTVSSGAVVTSGGPTISQKLNFGDTDGKLFVSSTLRTSALAGSGGLTKTGYGELTLSGTNTLTGPLTINAGSISFGSVDRLGDAGSPIVFDGASGRLSYSGSGEEMLSKDIILASGEGWVITDAFRRTLHLSGNISGSGALILEGRRFGILRLTGNNTMTGPIVLLSGDLEIDSDAALGAGGELSITGLGSTLRLLDDWITDRALRVERAILDTSEFDAQLSGPLIGGGSLTKTGQGTLTLTSPLISSTAFSVSQGTLALAGELTSKAVDIGVARGAKLHSDLTAPGVNSHLNDAYVGLSGEFAITGGSEGVLGESLRELRTTSSATVSLAPGAGEESGVFLHADAIIMDAPGLMIRADDLGGAGSRLSVGEGLELRSGIAIGVYTQPLIGGPEFFTTYESASDASGVIGFRIAPHSVAATIQNPSNGGIVAETANIVTASGGTDVVGTLNTINSLIVAQNGSVSLEAEQVLRIETGSILAQSGAGKATISGGALDLGNSVATLAVLRDMEVSSRVVGAGSLLKIGNGELSITGPIGIAGGITVEQGTLRLSGINSYAGPTIVRDTLRFNSDAALGSGSVLEVSRGRLHLEGSWTTDRRIVSTWDLDLFLDGHGAILNGPIEGFDELTIHGPGDLSLTGASTHSGAIQIGADLTLSGAGSIRSDMETTTGSLILDNRALPSSDRLRDDARIGGASLITVIGNANVGVKEVIGSLVVPSLGTSAGVRLVSPGDKPTMLLARTFSGAAGVRTFAGNDLGGSSGGFTRVAVELAPALSENLLVAALAADSPDGLPESFAFYDKSVDEHGVIGIRPIRDSEYTSSASIVTTFPSPDFLASSDVTVGSEREVINSLTMRESGAIRMTSGQTLQVQTGSVLVQSGADASINGGQLNLWNTARFIVNGDLTMNSALTSSRLEKYGPGTMRLGDVTLVDTMSIMEGTLVLDGSVSNGGVALGAPITTAKGAKLGGSGEIDGRVIVSGTLAPGDNDIGLIRSHDLTLLADSVLHIDLRSTSAFDRLEVAGKFSISGPVALNLALEFDPVDFADAFTLIANDGSDAVSLSSGGYFTFGGNELHEGSHFLANDQYFQISYTGGDGNDVVLRAVPEPSASLLVLSGLVGFLSRRRRSARVAA